MMKKLLFLLTLTLASLTTHATGYESDIIYIDGTQWELLGRPVYADTTLLHNLKVVLPIKVRQGIKPSINHSSP
jgi:hypothetical protein